MTLKRGPLCDYCNFTIEGTVVMSRVFGGIHVRCFLRAFNLGTLTLSARGRRRVEVLKRVRAREAASA
jgi:hypothetical protein